MLACSFTWMAFGGVISHVFGGLILEMSGSWNVLYRYQGNILIFSAIFFYFIPWFVRYTKQKKKRTISAQNIDL